MKHDIGKLPKWAQALFEKKEEQVEELKQTVKGYKQAHEVLCDYGDWFTVGIHTKEATTLYMLQTNRAQPVCSIGEGYVLLVGRRTERSAP